MALKQFTTLFRHCLWLAHDQRCFFCGDVIDFRDVHVDHVLPESLGTDASKLKAVTKSHSLPDTFDINGVENLVPTCIRCNSGKSSDVLDVGHYAVLVPRIQRKIGALRKCLERQESKAAVAKALAVLARAVDGGYERSDLLAGLIDHDLIKVDANGRPITFTQDGLLALLAGPQPRVAFSRISELRLWERGISMEEVVEALRSGVTLDGVEYDYQGRRRYRVSTGNGLNVVYTLSNASVMIVTCFWDDRN